MRWPLSSLVLVPLASVAACSAAAPPATDTTGGMTAGGSGSEPDAQAAVSRPPAERDARADAIALDTPPDQRAGTVVEPARDGGVAGAAAADANPPAQVGPCITQGTELCEDFETGQIDPKRWTIRKNTPAMVLVDGEHVHGGKFALHLKVTPGRQNTAALAETVTFPAKNNAFYARIYAYVSPDLPLNDGSNTHHQGLVVGSGMNALGRVERGLGFIGSKQFLAYSIYVGPPFLEYGPWSKPRVPPERWMCLELLEDGAGPAVRKIWLDDVELPELRDSRADPPPPKYDRLTIGVLEFHETPIMSDVWIDDIRVSSQRIGCATP